MILSAVITVGNGNLNKKEYKTDSVSNTSLETYISSVHVTHNFTHSIFPACHQMASYFAAWIKNKFVKVDSISFEINDLFFLPHFQSLHSL